MLGFVWMGCSIRLCTESNSTMQMQTEEALPLQFPVQAEHAWMYEPDSPFPFPVRHSLLDASNEYKLSMNDLEMLAGMAEQYVSADNNMTLNKCMLVRRAISYIDISQDLVCCPLNGEKIAASKLVQKSILYRCAENILDADWMPPLSSELEKTEKALQLMHMSVQYMNLHSNVCRNDICLHDHYNADLCDELQQHSTEVQLAAFCMSEMARDAMLDDDWPDDSNAEDRITELHAMQWEQMMREQDAIMEAEEP